MSRTYNVLLASVVAVFALATIACDKTEPQIVTKSRKAEKVEKAEKRLTPKEKYKKSSRERRHPIDYDTLPDDLEKFTAEVKKSLRWSTHSNELVGDYPADGTSDVREHLELEMTRDTLDTTFALGTDFLVNNQKPKGNFGYMYDWLTQEWIADDSQVRQAGALWGIALCHRWKPQAKTRKALQKGFEFWFDQTIPGPNGTMTVKYQDDRNTESGTVALLALSIIEYLTTEKDLPAKQRAELTAKLEGYLDFLQWMQRKNGLMSESYDVANGTKTEDSSPYFDGESLLAFCKAANRLGMIEYLPTIQKLARATATTYFMEALEERTDQEQTKGFYQWGSMSYAEYYDAQWPDYDLYADITLILGYWMSHVHETLKRGRNHAYAIEGLVSAYRIAKARKDTKALVDLLYVIDRSLYKLTSWQIGGPLADKNEFLREHPTDDPVALGGIMNSKKAFPNQPREAGDTQHELRIDVTQHQMHAVSLALEHVFTEEEY